MKLTPSILSSFCLVLLPGAAFAGTTDSSVGVSATVVASCDLSDVSNLAFGDLSVGDLPKNETSTFKVTCTSSTEYRIALDKGTNGSSTTDRKLASGSSATLKYELYQDADWASPWGEGGASTSTLGSNGSAVQFTIYGKIPDQTMPAPGDYADTVTITVEFQ